MAAGRSSDNDSILLPSGARAGAAPRAEEKRLHPQAGVGVDAKTTTTPLEEPLLKRCKYGDLDC